MKIINGNNSPDYWKTMFENLVSRVESITKQMKLSGDTVSEYAYDIESEIENLSEGNGPGKSIEN